jgi:4-amino-4-deoxy-L-arabinose transferase-like glycosyltransferase
VTSRRRALVLAVLALVAFAHAAFFIEHMRPDREQFWAAAPASAGGYSALARNILQGAYTQDAAAGTPAARPDTQRTPGYPLYVSGVYAVFGVDDGAVLWSHAVMFVLACLGVYALGRRVGGDRVGIVAGFFTALYAPIPKYGGMVWAEMLTTLLQVVALLLLAMALSRRSLPLYGAAGAVFGLLALTRPAFIFEPLLLMALVVLWAWRAGEPRAGVAAAATVLAVWALVLAPWAIFNYVRFGKATPTVVRTFGKQIWYGYWVSKFPTRVLIGLEDVVVRVKRGEAAPQEVPALVRPLGGAQDLMEQFVEEYVWQPPLTEPGANGKVVQDMLKDRYYFERARDHIAGDVVSYVKNQLFFVSFKYWAGEIPVRLLLIRHVPRAVIYAGFLVQAALVALAVVGAWRLRRRPMMLALVAAPLVYLYVIHLPFHLEPRYSVPVKPLLLVLAASGAVALLPRRFADAEARA